MVIALAVLCAMLIAALAWGFLLHVRALDHAYEEAAEERSSLLERIQRPDVAQPRHVPEMQPVTLTPPVAAASEGEYAWVGRAVPDYIKVGTVDGEVPRPANPALADVFSANES